MYGHHYRRTLILAASAALPLLWTPASAVAASTVPAVSLAHGALVTADKSGADRVFEADEGFRGEAYARELAERLFGIAGTPVDAAAALTAAGEALRFVDAQDPSVFFRMDAKTGDLSFSKGMGDYTAPVATKGLPGRDKAVDLALAHLKQADLLPRDMDQLVLRAVGGVAMSTQREDGRIAHYEKLVSVHFGRQIDGIDVGGPGSKIVVHLGRDGELVGLQRRWIELRETQKVAPTALLEHGEVMERTVEHLRREWKQAAEVDSAVPEPGYYDDGKGRIEPAYFVQAKVRHDEGGLRPLGVAKARPQPYLGIIPALRFSGADVRQQQPATAAPRLKDLRLRQFDDGDRDE